MTFPNRFPRARAAYSLMEMLLVLVLIGMLASLLLPSLRAPVAKYRLEQAAGDLRARLGNARLRAMETGRPHALTFTPNSDRYSIWSMNPPTQTSPSNRYQRRMFRLNGASKDRNLRFVASVSALPIGGASMADAGSRSNDPDIFRRLTREAAVPVVFDGDGTAQENVRIRIRDQRSLRSIDIRVYALAGTVRIETSP